MSREDYRCPVIGFACLVCDAQPGESCKEDLLVPANLPFEARIDYSPGPGVIYPGGLRLAPEPSRCWDCHCPLEIPVRREGTDRPVCRDCADMHAGGW